MLKYFLAASIVGLAAAECPNACSGHGTCGVFDMCTCYRNWQAADCSQRTCPFDHAHVDTPKGDLNHDNSVSTGSVLVGSQVYPHGTEELFPNMKDSAGTSIYNSAHYYMECSNKGICDRTTGECDCYDGYDGSACQRASCPNDCSGHGTCETISDLAAAESGNAYALWDKDATMGCKCDAGYTAADCSQRNCKIGVDPLYVDDTRARNTVVNLRLKTDAAAITGTFQLKFYDFWGEDYLTKPISWASSDGTPCVGASCATFDACKNVVDALKALPNNAVSNVVCTATDLSGGWNAKLDFQNNPGYLKSPEIVNDLTAGTNKVGFNVYTSVTGENTDYFASKCEGVTVNIKKDATWAGKSASVGHLAVSETETKLLKACLGDSDGKSWNNIEVYNWDYGTMEEATSTANLAAAQINVMGAFPHAVKVMKTGGTQADLSEYHIVWYDANQAVTTEMFRIVNYNSDMGGTTDFDIYTTNGVVQQLGVERQGAAAGDTTGANGIFVDTTGAAVDDTISSQADKFLTGNATEIRIVGYFAQYSNTIYTNIDASCESTNPHSSRLHNCIQKNDKLFVVDGCFGRGTATEYFGGQTGSCAADTNPTAGTGNLYTVTKIYTKPYDEFTDAVYNDDDTITGAAGTATGVSTTGAAATDGQNFVGKARENRFVIEVDHNIPWDGGNLGDPDQSDADTGINSGYIVLFKFTPAADGAGSYTFVSECSNRGTCDRESGLCQCFKGYTSDNCSVQSSLAV
jgi:hypothetical protein